MAHDQSGVTLVSAWEDLVRAVGIAQRRSMEPVEATGLPGQSFAALHLLLRADDHRLPMSRLARELSMTTGGITKLADRLGREGLIDRRGSADDRRMIYAVLTDKGTDLVTAAQRLYETALQEHVINVLGADRLLDVSEELGRLLPLATSDADESLVINEPGDEAAQQRRRASDR